jgi:hypothetical protein
MVIPASGIMTLPSQADPTETLVDAESGWDEDEEASRTTSKLHERSLLHIPLDGGDDPTLHYCQPSLQTKWDYWALLGF